MLLQRGGVLARGLLGIGMVWPGSEARLRRPAAPSPVVEPSRDAPPPLRVSLALGAHGMRVRPGRAPRGARLLARAEELGLYGLQPLRAQIRLPCARLQLLARRVLRRVRLLPQRRLGRQLLLQRLLGAPLGVELRGEALLLIGGGEAVLALVLQQQLRARRLRLQVLAPPVHLGELCVQLVAAASTRRSMRARRRR